MSMAHTGTAQSPYQQSVYLSNLLSPQLRISVEVTCSSPVGYTGCSATPCRASLRLRNLDASQQNGDASRLLETLQAA